MPAVFLTRTMLPTSISYDALGKARLGLSTGSFTNARDRPLNTFRVKTMDLRNNEVLHGLQLMRLGARARVVFSSPPAGCPSTQGT
jgi:hypothetical protein